MKKYGLIATMALIVVTNVFILSGVAYNRSSEPDAVVTLTERELHWQDNWRSIDREDSGLYLRLQWNRPGYRSYNWEYRENSWFNKEKLSELGFDTNYPLDAKNASRYYNRQLPRQAYVVLEYDGDAYKNWSRKLKNQIQKVKQELSEEKKLAKKKNLENNIWNMERQSVTHTHLFAVDAGPKPEKLREHYADSTRYIIIPAVFGISLHYTPRKKDQPKSSAKRYLRGLIREILIPEIHIPSDYRSFFISDIKTHTKTYLPKGKPLSDLEPRYQVTLNYGKRHEPWIADVKKLK